MSVILQFEICQSSDCSSLTFVETTGAYNDTTNPNGWGTPNEDTTDAVSAVLTVTLESGSTYNIDLFSDGFPTTSDTIEYLIDPVDIGMKDGGKLTDQIITFTYTVVTGTTTYTQNIQQAFYCQVQCCVLSMFVGLDVECDCSIDQINNALKSYALLKGLIYSANCGNKTNFNNILAQLQKLCLNNNCQNCQ